MSYRKRISLFFFWDSIMVVLALLLAIFVTNTNMTDFMNIFWGGASLLLCAHHIYAYILKLYKKSWLHASIDELVILLKTASLTTVTIGSLQLFLLHTLSIRPLLVMWMLHILFIGGSRFSWRVLSSTHKNDHHNKRRTLIIGAGSAGTMVARQLKHSLETELKPVAFIDDDQRKQKLDIFGIPVVGGKDNLDEVVQTLKIEHIVIALPSLPREVLNRIVERCVATGVRTQTIPRLEDLMTGRISVNTFRDVRVEDLLGRETVPLDMEEISAFIRGKTVLITGAGGSIGSEISRQLCSFFPRKLILLGHGENSIYTIHQELSQMSSLNRIEFVTEIADIQDGQKIMDLIKFHQPQIIYHAAAHKHVPLMEANPEEAVKNNLLGTLNVAHAASWNDVEAFVMISTDKAVNPTSVMGATKRLAEVLIQNMNKDSQTKFVAVRFGNVLGSRGSVIPLFKKQIQAGGPVTVTHPDMVRYFMTIPEASKLVLQAGALAKGGEIFVLDMGEPVKILDLAKNLIRLSGNTIEEIGIQFTGIRPGEKLFEELLKNGEIHEEQVHPNIYVGKTLCDDSALIMNLIEEFNTMDRKQIREKLLSLSNDKKAERKLALL